MLVDYAESEVGRVEVIADGLLGHHDRLRHEAAFGADQPPWRSCCSGSGMPLGVSAYWFAGATLTGTILTSVQLSGSAVPAQTVVGLPGMLPRRRGSIWSCPLPYRAGG